MRDPQLDLLESPPRAPYQKSSPASRRGAKAVEHALDSQIGRALQAYRRAGKEGLTDRELKHETGIPLHLCPARRGKLIEEGRVEYVRDRKSRCPGATSMSVGARRAVKGRGA